MMIYISLMLEIAELCFRKIVEKEQLTYLKIINPQMKEKEFRLLGEKCIRLILLICQAILRLLV